MLGEPAAQNVWPESGSSLLKRVMNDRFSGPSSEIDHGDIAQVFNSVDIPSCPSIVNEVLLEAQRDEPDLNRLAALFEKDPGMSAVVIKLANSAMFGGRFPVDSVRRALERLGTRNVVSVVLAAGLRASLEGQSPELVERFWRRAASLATASGLIARRLYGVSPDSAYLYGLFRDAAVPVLMRRFPDYGEKIEDGAMHDMTRIEAENANFPYSHAVIGYLLAQNWKLPAVVAQAIRFHHEPDIFELTESELPSGALTLIAAAHMADHLISGVLGERDGELDSSGFLRAQVHLGISDEDLADLTESLEGALNTP
jgi:HD-like signal output (HDOD) protein